MPLIKAGRAVADPLHSRRRWRAAAGGWRDHHRPGALAGGARRLIEPRRDAARACASRRAIRSSRSRAISIGSAVIALEFPKFNDGRAYSQARLLRERYGYRGEIRAAGKVLRDQLLFMHRCGFDAYETADQVTAEVVERSLASFSLAYQPAADGRPSVMELRHGRAAGATKAATDKGCVGGHDRCTAG